MTEVIHRIPLRLPVALAPDEPPTSEISAELCLPIGHQKHVLQILLPGATYDHTYWDTPGYSYVETMAQAGYATLNVDRIGSGQSSYPDVSLVTLAADAYTIHQLVNYFRPIYHRILLVGHSLGSVVAIVEQTTHHDVDGLILSGFSLGIQPALLTAPLPFVPSGPPGYLTTIPGMRAAMFYNLADADPAVVTQDEATKTVLSSTEFTQLFAFMTDPNEVAVVSGVDVPMLGVIGQDDAICPQGSLVGTGYVLANSGHDVNLHRNAKDWYSVALGWLDQQEKGPGWSPTPPTS